MITEQVKRAIKKLKASGFKRSDYSVRVEKLEDGCYDRAVICLKLKASETGKYLAGMLKQGLSVVVMSHPTGFQYSIFDSHEQTLKFVGVSTAGVNYQRNNCLRIN